MTTQRKQLTEFQRGEIIGICKNLVDSMPRRISAVIANKGNPTKY